ncbi:hypothetical protein M0R89_14440 [Halorussus limi]|uniref:Uncharacterized protein n=1 Tax=Halorussus limi TaxID=2938695 RepID=A0A8U0HRL0_9EURY|nr:hypothetical protein [Halorussus limi]UPV73732.1 hypothetical protein M0R89_14440 [Halorussus limi]
MAEKTTVAFRVAEDVKAEWEDAAEGPEYNSLSHLIRLSVQKEIASEGRQTAAEDGQPATEASGEVLDSLTRLERTVGEMHDELEAIGREDRDEELYDLEQVLLEILPTAPSGLQEPDEAQIENDAATAEDLSARIGARTSDVSDALERLATNSAQVRDATHRTTDEAYYWRVE